MMKYNQIGVAAIQELESILESARIPFEMRRKMLSILSCVDYQIEEGECPPDVLAALQEAISNWLRYLPDEQTQNLMNAITVCFKKIAKTMD